MENDNNKTNVDDTVPGNSYSSNAIFKIGDTWQCIFSKTIANNGAVPIKNNIWSSARPNADAKWEKDKKRNIPLSSKKTDDYKNNDEGNVSSLKWTDLSHPTKQILIENIFLKTIRKNFLYFKKTNFSSQFEKTDN